MCSGKGIVPRCVFRYNIIRFAIGLQPERKAGNMQIQDGRKRGVYLLLGATALAFAGVIYAWSILKAPLAEAFGWTGTALTLNYTLTMTFYCVGGFLGGLFGKRLGCRVCLLAAAILSGAGFFLASRLQGGSIVPLYLFYGFMAGLGIGLAYNVIISTVSAWFPDKKGFCSGALMMSFGVSALLTGKLAGFLIDGPGWRTAYLVIGGALVITLTATALGLHLPPKDWKAPDAQQKKRTRSVPEAEEYSAGQMLRRASFWLAFFCVVCMAAVGNTAFSFARDLALSVGAGPDAAVTLVGVLSVCNGLGRILVGVVYDRAGRKATMLAANGLTIVAAGVTLLAVWLRSLPLCVAGLCLIGLSYGAPPTISSALVREFYGAKHFQMNFAVMNFTLLFAAGIATVAGSLLEATGAFLAPLLLLLALSLVSLLLDLCIRKP